jgi:hypothetical protein
MNSAHNSEPRSAQSTRAVLQKCVVCGDPIGESGLYKIHRKEGEPTLLCCPDCAIQYIYLARPPADGAEEELRAYEKSTHFFIGEDKWKWWS